MESIVRASIVYLFLLVLFRLTGKRKMVDATPFDFIFILIISEAANPGLVKNDYSLTNSLLVILTLVVLDRFFALTKNALPRFKRVVEGEAVILVENGTPIENRMRKEQVDLEDVLEAARGTHGLSKLEDVKFAILEKSGDISIIPKKNNS